MLPAGGPEHKISNIPVSVDFMMKMIGTTLKNILYCFFFVLYMFLVKPTQV